MKILFLPNSYTSASARFRLWQFVDPLTTSGQKMTVRMVFPTRDWKPRTKCSWLNRVAILLGSLMRVTTLLWVTRDIERFDVVMINRDLLPGLRFTAVEEWIIKRNPHFIFDFDDSIHLGSRCKKLERLLPLFNLLTPGNSYLAEYARTLNQNVEIWPTVVDSTKYQSVTQRLPGPIRIGWSGSDSTLSYSLPVFVEFVEKLAQIENFEFVIISNTCPTINWTSVKWRFIPWDEKREIENLQLLDIGIMPLEDTPFERGKCGLKAIQYMAIGIPALISPVGINTQLILDGSSGFHCISDQEWIDRLRLLLHDEILRRSLGKAARERVVAHYSIQSILPRIISSFEKVTNS